MKYILINSISNLTIKAVCFPVLFYSADNLLFILYRSVSAVQPVYITLEPYVSIDELYL